MLHEKLSKVLVVLKFISIVVVAVDQPIIVGTERLSAAIGLRETVASPALHA